MSSRRANLLACAVAALVGVAPAHAWEPDRTVLPVQMPPPPEFTELDARNVKTPPWSELKAPAGAPNVVIVLIDDMGFGVPSTFGGPVPMPTLDRIAQEGLRYNNFHTTALCSPTRAALKSGRNHHVNNMGSITETATGFPGQTGQIPNTVAPVAEMLRLNGYSTGAFGKWHELATWETSVSGAFARWPTVGGGLTWGRVTLAEGTIDLPSQPAEADAERVTKVLQAIAAAIPPRFDRFVEPD